MPPPLHYGIIAILFLALNFLIVTPMKAQSIQIDSTFTTDSEIFPFEPGDTIYGLSITGTVHLFSDTSLVRVILSDINGNEWMVYEAYPMIVEDTVFEIEEECDETCYLNEFLPEKIEIQIIDSRILIEELLLENIQEENIEELRRISLKSKELQKISSINSYLESNNMLWRAGETSLSSSTYSEKKSMFGEKYCLIGFEFYIGGIYAPYRVKNYTSIESNIVDSFDWRNRHGADNPSSYYFDGNPDIYTESCGEQTFSRSEEGNGWMTAVKSQKLNMHISEPECEATCLGTCYIYSTIGAVEALVNLYFILTDAGLDLSEQQILDCKDACDCDGQEISYASSYVKLHGVIDETNYPWQDDDEGPCNETWISNGQFRIKIYDVEDFHNIDDLSDIDFIKQSIITNGPLSAGLHYPDGSGGFNHAMTLLGFGTIKEGEVFHLPHGEPIIADEEDAGKLYWIFKESYSPAFGDQGYVYHLYDQFYNGNFFIELNKYQVPVDDIKDLLDESRNCLDTDLDGYCFWGIGSRQGCNNCDDCPVLEDCDDFNPRIGPYASDYSGTSISPNMELFLYKEWLCNDQVENGGFLYVDNTCFSQETSLEFNIINNGTAQLNLSPFGNPVSLSGPDQYEFYIENEDQPDIKIMFNDQTNFVIKYTGNPLDNETKIVYVNIAVLDSDMPDFEFAIVINSCQFSAQTEYINGSVDWLDPYKIVQNDVIINSGGILTITGKVSFSSETDIFVAPGGTLAIDGGLLTSGCSSLWNGIDVWGDPRSPQMLDYQGLVRIVNGGTVEHAVNAIETGNFPEPRRYPSGGMVSCTDAIFKDNITDVALYPFINRHPSTHEILPNFSRFKRTLFKTTEELYSAYGQAPYSHIILDNVGYVNILGCEFHNEATAHSLARGMGILSYGSGFFASPACLSDQMPCPEYVPCHFENLDYGIRALNSNTLFTITVNGSRFIDNRKGILMSLVNDATINKNQFYLNADDDYFEQNDVLVGIYTEGCSRYQIEENKITGLEPNTYQLIGMHILNSLPDYNEIYNDTLVNLTTGITAAGENRHEKDHAIGLCVKCNDFFDCRTDINVTPEGGEDKNRLGIATIQGLPGSSAPPGVDPNTMGAGNRFSEKDPNSQDYNFYNDDDELDQIIYTHQPNIINAKLRPEPISNIERVQDEYVTYSKEISCPSHLSSGGIQLESEKITLSDENETLLSYSDTFAQYIDGGDTPGLTFEILISFPDEALDLRQQLIDASPYLSDTVMKSAIEKDNVLLNAMLRDVLVANPQSAKSADILNTLENKYDPLPDYMMDEVLEGKSILGGKENLEREMAMHDAMKSRAFSKIIRWYKNDTLDASSKDSVLTYLEDNSSPETHYQLAFCKFNTGDSIDVVNILNDISSDFLLTTTELNTHGYYEELFDLLVSMEADSNNVDSTLFAGLLSLMNETNEPPGIYARNLLIILDSLEYNEPIFLNNTIKSQPVNHKKIIQNKAQAGYMKVFPNPAGNFFIIEYNLSPGFEKPSIIVTDLVGQNILSFELNDSRNQILVNSKGLAKGIYLIKLYNNSKISEIEKISIAR